ncbi:MAG: ACP S-malonyltransferase [Clostridia bacterium]|nr:ACP S-malonyltransferase [Clostridia bacterium]
MPSGNKPKFAVIFPGQGSQYVGMGKSLYEKYPTAKDIFSLADETLAFPLSSLCFDGDIQELTKTCNTQPALLTVCYIMYQVYIKANGLNPELLLGHSLGEITALVCANAISFTDGLKIVRQRGLYMQECGDKTKGGMLAVLVDDFEWIKQLCREISKEDMILNIANYNSNNQIVVSGDIRALQDLKSALTQKGIKSIFLNVSAPFHSSIMQAAADKLYAELNKYHYDPIDVPIISNISGDLYMDQDNLAKTLSEQIISPVKWVQSIKKAHSLGADLFVEVGPKNILKNLNKNICKDIPTLSLDLEEDLNTFYDVLGITG